MRYCGRNLSNSKNFRTAENEKRSRFRDCRSMHGFSITGKVYELGGMTSCTEELEYLFCCLLCRKISAFREIANISSHSSDGSLLCSSILRNYCRTLFPPA